MPNWAKLNVHDSFPPFSSLSTTLSCAIFSCLISSSTCPRHPLMGSNLVHHADLIRRSPLQALQKALPLLPSSVVKSTVIDAAKVIFFRAKFLRSPSIDVDILSNHGLAPPFLPNDSISFAIAKRRIARPPQSQNQHLARPQFLNVGTQGDAPTLRTRNMAAGGHSLSMADSRIILRLYPLSTTSMGDGVVKTTSNICQSVLIGVGIYSYNSSLVKYNTNIQLFSKSATRHENNSMVVGSRNHQSAAVA